MKLKSLVLASSMLLASAAFAATQATPVKAMQFVVNNETGVVISGFYVFPGITNMTPTSLPPSTIQPGGSKHLMFHLVDTSKGGGIAIAAWAKTGDYAADINGGVSNPTKSDPDQELSYNCQSHNPDYTTTCTASVNSEGVYTVTTDILPTITK